MEKKITATGLFEGLKRSRFTTAEGITINGYTITESVTYQNNLQEAKPLTFENCLFEDDIKFESSGSIELLKFTNCIFKKSVSIKDFKRELYISACTFENEVLLIVKESKKIHITDSKIISQFSIQGVCGSLHIQDINKHDQKSGLKGTFNLRGTAITSLFADNVRIHTLLIQAGTSIGLHSKLNEIISSHFSISNTKINGNMKLSKCDIGTMILESLIESGNRYIEIFDRCNIDDAHFLLDTLHDTLIRQTIFTKLTLSGTNKGKFIIEDALINWLRLINVFNERNLIFSNIFIPGKGATGSNQKILEIKSSNLGKADFLKCSFSDSLLDFENSKIAEIFSSATTFPRKPLYKTLEAYAQAQLAYGQLSAAFGKQGDTVRASTYQSYEIAAHFKNMTWHSTDFFLWLNLWLNKISNNFGRWWALGLVFTFSIGTIFFLCVVFSSVQHITGTHTLNDSRLFISYLKFMNPLRSFDTEAIFKISDKPAYLTLTLWSYFWDFIGRLLVAYGFYQTIQAFRRFGRK